MYATEKETRSGQWTGKVVDGALIFTPVNGGKPLHCARKPNTQEILLGLKWFTKNRENLAGDRVDKRQEAADLFPSSPKISNSPVHGFSQG